MGRPIYIVGFDPGTEIVGWAILGPGQPRLGVIRPKGARSFRLGWILEDVQRILADLPDRGVEVALERAFVGDNPATSIILGEARGVLMAAAGRRNWACFDYPPATMKKTVTNNGRAEKDLVARFVAAELKIDADLLPYDATDAAGIALTHKIKRHSGIKIEALE